MILSRLRLAVIVSLSLAASAAAQDEPPPKPAFPNLPVALPAGSGTIQPCLEELEGRVRCGRYRVHEDRESRSGRTIDLAFVIADALTYFFGGPGSSVTESAPG